MFLQTSYVDVNLEETYHRLVFLLRSGATSAHAIRSISLRQRKITTLLGEDGQNTFTTTDTNMTLPLTTFINPTVSNGRVTGYYAKITDAQLAVLSQTSSGLILMA